MDPTRPATHSILRKILERAGRPFTQLELAKEANVSHPWAHHVVHWLVGLGHVRKAVGRFELVNPAGIVGLYPIFRDMRSDLVFEIDIRVPRGADAAKALGADAIACLTTALARYSDYPMPGAVQLYAAKGKIGSMRSRLLPYAGGTTRVQVYQTGRLPLLSVEIKDQATDPIRTTIDLACSNQLYLARDLMRTQWGIEIGA